MTLIRMSYPRLRNDHSLSYLSQCTALHETLLPIFAVVLFSYHSTESIHTMLHPRLFICELCLFMKIIKKQKQNNAHKGRLQMSNVR